MKLAEEKTAEMSITITTCKNTQKYVKICKKVL